MFISFISDIIKRIVPAIAIHLLPLIFLKHLKLSINVMMVNRK